MAKPTRNSGRADAEDASARTKAPAVVVDGGDAAAAEAGDTVSAAPAADSIGAGATEGDALAGGAAVEKLVDAAEVHGDVTSELGADLLLDTALETIDSLRALLGKLDDRSGELLPAGREMLRQETLELERFLRGRRPADAPAVDHVDGAEDDDAPGQPTKAQAAAAVGIPADHVFAWRWDGKVLTVVTVAGQKLRFEP